MTTIPFSGGTTLQLHGLAGFDREVIKLFNSHCATCAAKRANAPNKRPAVHAIRVEAPFEVCQVSLLAAIFNGCGLQDWFTQVPPLYRWTSLTWGPTCTGCTATC